MRTWTAGWSRIRAISVLSILGVTITGLVVLAGTGLSRKIITARQAQIAANLQANHADSPAYLVDRLRETQYQHIQLFVPGMKEAISLPAGLCSFDPTTFPETFLKGLVYDVENGSPVYHLKLREVKATREIEVLDANGTVFYIFKPAVDYDSTWLARLMRPQDYTDDALSKLRADDEAWLDPANVQMEIALIPDAYVEAYADGAVTSLWDALAAGKLAGQSSKSTSSLLSGGMVTMMRMAGADTGIVVSVVGAVSTGMALQVDYPDTLTNGLDVMACSNLVGGHWWLLATNLVTTGTNSLTWVDTAVTSGADISNRFYRVGSATDSDLDGIPDGQEVILYGTDPLRVDTDGDGYPDSYEVLHGGDPTNSSSLPVPTVIVTNGLTTIQAAINSVTQDYSIVLVKAGIYTNTGNRDLHFDGRKMMLVSESGASDTVIDCQYAGRGFNFTNSETALSILKGFTIRNGKADWGAGIRCQPGSPTITDCVLAGNVPSNSTGTYGGCGICVKGGVPLIAGTTFVTNGVLGSGIGGGAVLVTGGAILTNCVFHGNISGDGGAIKAAPTGTAVVVVSGCTMSSNSAYYGGGLWISNNVTVSGCLIQSNAAGILGGGALCAGVARIEDSVVASNAANSGAGVHFMNIPGTGSPVLSGCEIRDNRTAYGGIGGGIYYASGCQPALVLSNTLVSGNASEGGTGGGLFVNAGGLVMVGGGINSNSAKADAGGFIALPATLPVLMTNVAVIGNSAQGPDARGGLFISGASSVQLTGLVISNNSVATSNGVGGLYVSGLGIAVDQCDVVGNRVNGSGGYAGGAYVTVAASPGTASVTRCHIANNKSGSSGGLSIANPYGWVMVRRCVISGNEADDSYGGLYANSGNYGTIIENTAILNNRAGTNAGAGFSYAGTLQNCVIAGNTCGIVVLPGGFIGRYQSGCVVARNGVVWGNSGAQLAGGIRATYSCVQGGYTNDSSSNIITNDPRLVDGYRLLSTNSPCIGAGTSAGLPATDINGDPWADPQAPDIGCDGFQFVDSNSNGINDEWEQYYFGDLSRDGTGDADQDLLTDAQEYADGCVPVQRDTDGDSLPDGYEVARGLDPVGSNDAAGDWNHDGIANSNEFQGGSLAVRVTVEDTDHNDDTWQLLLNGEVVGYANSGNGWSDSRVVYLQAGTTARFMFQRPETGQGGGTDEYTVDFQAVDWPSNQVPWIASAGNAALSSNVAWNGSTPPDVSGIYWEFTLPTNMLQQDVKAGGTRALTTDPINTINGNITLEESDLAVACPAFDLVFARSYNSATTASNTLGRGWIHNLNWSLTTVSNMAYGSRAGTFKVLATGDGGTYWFCAETDGSFTLAPPKTAKLALAFTNGEYRVTWPDGTVARFDASGAIQRLEDSFGTGLTFTHNAGKLTQVAHDNGKALALSYTDGLLTRVDSPSTNLFVVLSYNADGLLTNVARVADGVAKSTCYDYENVCQVLTQRVNAAGQVFAYSVGYVTNSPAWNGNPAVVRARGTGMTLEPATADWYSHTLNYTNPGNFCTRVTYYRGDTNLVHEYAYDPVKMLVTGITGPGTPGVAAWSNTWAHFQYDAAQNITNQSVKDGASGDTLEAVAAYDGRHNVLSNGVSYCGNAATNWILYSWNADDTLASATDPAGHKTAFEYTNGLISVVRECTNGASGFETRFFYTTNGLLASVTNANGHGLGYENDAAGYVSRVVPALGPETQFTRNALGQVTEVIVPGDTGYRTNSLTVNALGQVTAVTHPDGLQESFAFDALGNLTNVVDVAGRTNVLAWYPTGKPASVSRWLDGPNPTNVTVSFAYDRQFNTLRITDPMGRAVESYKLDMQDRPVSVTNIQNQVMTINWGVGDHVRSLIRFDGTTVTNLYGTDGRLTEVRMPGTAAMAGVTNKYSYYVDGSLKTASNVVGVVSNAYDGANRLAYTTGAVPQSAVSYGYYPAGQVSNVTTVAGTTSYTLDAADRLSGMAAPEGNYGFGYASNGLLGAMSYPNGVTCSNRFDVLDRATNIEWKAAGGTTVRNFGYAFNAAGMITNVAREDGSSVAYSYDSLDRLTSETQYAATGLTYAANWNYDLAGNRTLAVTNGVTNLYLYAAGNVLTNFGSGTLVQHDAAGNITNLQYSASRKLGLKWDSAYQLTEVRTNGTLAETYQYDVLGRRIRIIVGTATNSMVYDGPHMVAEFSNNVLARAYTYGPGIDNVLAMTTYGTATNTFFYLKDHLGSVHALVNTNGAVVEQYRYTAWGETTVLSSNGAVLAASAYGNRFTWMGREYSWSTKLHFFRSRYYSAELGRWLSKDRIGISGGANLFEAFNNAPTIFSDAFGNCPDMELPDGWPLKNLMYEDPLKARIRDMMRDFKNTDWSFMVPIAGEVRLVEQYGLKAIRDGVYPVMKRGFPKAVDWVSLKAGDIWKYGTTKNPLTRYTQKFLRETALRYEKLSSGSLSEALSAEKAKIVEYLTDRGVLPPGNKILK